MKLDRMMAILTLLQEREWLQAGELAERFEVSVRTIYRDVEALNLSGIPIETRQGTGGGIRVMPGYKLDKSLFTERDLSDVVTALKSFSMALPGTSESVLLEKLNHSVPKEKKQDFQRRTNEVIIDISPWGDDERIRGKLTVIREAIEGNRTITFGYVDGQGRKTSRVMEPQTLVFKGMNWYVFGWCREASDFRMFRISRMTSPSDTGEMFSPKDFKAEERPWHTSWVAPENNMTLVMRFGPESASRLIDWFDPEDMETQPDGCILVKSRMPDTPWVDAFILGFGSAGEVLEPGHVRTRIRKTVCGLADLYGCGD